MSSILTGSDFLSGRDFPLKKSQRKMNMPRYVHNIWVEEDGPQSNIKCKNFDIWCKGWVDEHPGGTRASIKGLCINCDMKFGKPLVLVGPTECPVCLETVHGIKQINCDHSSCNECFLKMHIGIWDLDTRPIEPPYETMIDEDGDEIVKLPNHAWEKWNEEEQKWIDDGYAKDNTRKCPLCRS